MAINKVGSKGIEDGSVATADLADNVVTSAKLGDGEVTNAKLANTTVTLAGESVTLGASLSLTNKFVDWQTVITAAGSSNTAVSGQGYFIDTTSDVHTVTLPASASRGDFIAIKDYAGTFATNNLTIARNGHNIQGVANDSLISTNRASLVLVYVDSTKGWLYWEEHNVGDLEFPLFISATGGTVTESGDYKIHTFTGDGCFVVSNAGQGSPTYPSTVDYLVVAGGGSAGGGAGGFRMSNSTCMPAPTTSPLANPTGITVTATTYPITIGAGATSSSSKGSNTIFSTITSAGGGSGGNPGCVSNTPGGSGAGEQEYGPNPFAAGTGNTPPVSPSQGNNGGTIADPTGSIPPSGSSIGKGAGGGAGAAGAAVTLDSSGNTSPTSSISGGVGSYVSPTMAGCNGTTGPVPGVRYFSGGGAGFTQIGAGIRSHGSGGAGGGAPSNPAVGNANATANTGGGGSSAYFNNNGQGGTGIVIIRYKFQ
ncbi:hypothetical protein N9X67_04845 [Amylibacter sp.]|nr:hypothetical protein [Amylibacter sp.]